MKIVTVMNTLGPAGTEKAACRWVRGLQERKHDVMVLALLDGPRRAELERLGIETVVLPPEPRRIADELKRRQPPVLHVHAPGHPHPGDALGEALRDLPKIPVVQTNIFGQFENPREDAWTDYRLFISWTCAVQAAERIGARLDEGFFRRCSVTVNPLDPDDGPAPAAVRQFRAEQGIAESDLVFGHLGRPDPIRWNEIPLAACRRALRVNRRLKFLLRTPPPEIVAAIQRGPDADRYVVLPFTSDAEALRLTAASMDAVLHYSRVGESFGYGIAEPMNYGKPVIVNSSPWGGQTQLELARDGECGIVASTVASMTRAILRLAGDAAWRAELGANARRHIRRLADPETSTGRLETVLRAAAERRDNPLAADDLRSATAAADYLRRRQYGHTLGEQLVLRPMYYRVRFSRWRQRLRSAQRRPAGGGAI